MQALKALSPEEVVIFLTQTTVLLAVAHIGGEVMRRFRQPALIGNILGGMLLGPSILGHFFPSIQLSIFVPDQNQANMLAAITWVGLLLFLMEAGFDVRLDLLRKNASVCMMVSAGGLVIPMISGFMLGQYLPESMLEDPSHRLVFSIFMAVAMSISAIPPLAMILRDKNMLRDNIGQVSLGAAMLDDIFAWILVGITTSLHVTGNFSLLAVGKSAGSAVLFLGVSFFFGLPLMKRFIRWHNTISPGASPQLSILIIFGIAGSLITSWLGLESALGVFIVGMLIGSAGVLQHNAIHALGLLVSSFLAPLYFGLAGLRLNLWSIYEGSTFGLLLLVIGVACVGKFLGVYLGAWMSRLPQWDRIAMGFGMNARGGTEIIIATMGMSIGLLTREMFSIIVVMAIVTVILSGPTLAWALSKVQRRQGPVDDATPEFIYQEAIEDPAASLVLAEKEEIRLARRLKRYTAAMRLDALEPMRAAADAVHEPFTAVAGETQKFLQQLASQSLCPAMSEQVLSLESRLGLLRYLEECIRSLFMSGEKLSAHSPMRRNLGSYIEGLDFLLDMLINALAEEHSGDVALFQKLTGSDRELIDRVRSEYLMSEGGCTAPERLIMFEVAHGFEQITWLLHRFALLINPPAKVI